MTTHSSQPILTGIPSSRGVAEGTVRVVHRYQDNKEFQEGDILVTKITYPPMVTMMARAAAIVCDIGGLTSHPSIISRELGIPCIVNTGTATTELKSGMYIRVDGNEGKIYIVPRINHKEIDSFMDAVIKGWGAMDWRTFQGDGDCTQYDPLIAEPWTKKILDMIDHIESRNMSYKETASLFTTASCIRVLAGVDVFVAKFAKASQENILKIFEFYNSLLKEHTTEDPYAHNVNRIHADEELDILLGNMIPATPEVARTLGRLVSALYNLSYALFSDMYPQICYENYGPYIHKKFNTNTIIAIKEFHELKPTQLWQETIALPYHTIRIVAVYEEVNMRVDSVSHTVYEGNLIEGLRQYKITTDDTPISIEKVTEVTQEYERMAALLFERRMKSSLEEKKETYYHQKAYNYYRLYTHLGLDWKPSEEILTAARNKPLTNFKELTTQEETNEFIRMLVDPRIEFEMDKYLV